MHFHGMHILVVLPFYSNERAIRYVTVHTSERAPAWFPLVCVPVVKESANRIDHVPKLFNKARLPRQATVAGYRGRLPMPSQSKLCVPRVFFEVDGCGRVKLHG